MKGKVNLFQASMLRWRALHPYNAVHVMALPGEPDAAKLDDAIGRTLTAWGLTGLTLDARRGRFEYRGGPANVAVRRVDADGLPPIPVLEREIEHELNSPFPASGSINPFRFFAIPGEGSFRLGLGYDHFVAAGDSIVMLMCSIGNAYREGRTDRDTPPQRYARRCRSVLVRNAGAVIAGAPALGAMRRSTMRSVRPRYPAGTDGHNAFLYARLDAADFERMRAAAKRLGVTLNDTLLAIGLAAVAPLAGRRDPARPRHEIGAASIMNIRREFQVPTDAFGQFLSSFRISHPVPEGISLERLIRDVHAQTSEIKRRRLYLQTLIAMAASGTIWRFLDDERRALLHSKLYPTFVGISNLDVHALWRAGGARTVPEYIRAVPTGPASPLVVAVTSDAASLHLGFSFRIAAFDRAEVARMSGLFVERCRQLSG